jgi:general secretion pathway protein E
MVQLTYVNYDSLGFPEASRPPLQHPKVRMPYEAQKLVRIQLPPTDALAGPKPTDPEFIDAFSKVLQNEGLADTAATLRAQRAAATTGERFDFVLVKLGLISESDLCVAYSVYCGFPLVGIEELPEQRILPDRLKLSFLKANRIVPISISGGRATIATVDPFATEAPKAIGYMLDVAVEIAVIAPAIFERAIDKLYSAATEESQSSDDHLYLSVASDSNEFDIERLRDIANEAPVIKLVNQIIARAVERGVSDIHIEPGRDEVVVRYRVDGFLQLERVVPAALRAALTTRIKIMAKLDIAERRLPHDGRIKTAVRGVEIDIRVSTIPAVFGESIVMRILDRSRVELDFTKLGLSDEIQVALRSLMSLPNGIILVTGPTGSGKTTTLYTALKHLNKTESKLFTVEDPIEYQLSGINQVQIQPKIGLDFPSALRSILRQDPDILMIGEIRDLDTARIAIQASLTGHLVFSTLHTNSSMAAITRLIDIGLERYLLASTVVGVMAQRLVRKLCIACARRCGDGGASNLKFKIAPPENSAIDVSEAREAVGCEKCDGTGYRGRTTISELLIVDERMQECIGRRSHDQQAMEKLAREAGFRTLYEDGLAKVGAGITTLEEVLRVTRAS